MLSKGHILTEMKRTKYNREYEGQNVEYKKNYKPHEFYHVACKSYNMARRFLELGDVCNDVDFATAILVYKHA
jgi:hypothetical protein